MSDHNLKDLAEKVEAGSAKPHEVFNAFDTPCQCLSMQSRAEDAQNAYKGSLDAAKALHEAVLPGWGFVVWTGGKGDFAATVSNAPPGASRSQKSGKSSCPARAWLLAILKALIAQEESK